MRTRQLPFWKISPFTRLLPPLAAGIILQWRGQPGLLASVSGLLACLLLLAGFQRLTINKRFRYRKFQGTLIILTWLFTGMLLVWQADIRHRADWFMKQYRPGDSLKVLITGSIKEKPNSFQAEASVTHVIRNGKTGKTSGRLLLYFSKKEFPGIREGDILRTASKPTPVSMGGNPGSFDYGAYSAMQNIFHSIYLTKDQWSGHGHKPPAYFMRQIESLKTSIVSCLRKYLGADKEVLGIAEALLIGFKDDLDKDLVREYSQAGVVHIIAISGLHLGLIYLVLTHLLARLPLLRKHKNSQYLISLAALWIFTILTGSSASVLRSAVMFTCMLGAKILSKNASVHQSLAASAFILLCCHPFFLWDAGFQLSYAALAGIIFLQKPLQKLCYIPSSAGRKCWELFTVTLAAQAGTFPVCLYYFHQFPTYFFLTNMLAVPLSTIILFGEIALLCFSFAPPVATLIAGAVAPAIQCMNAGISLANKLPLALIENIYANTQSTFALYGTMIFCFHWLLTRQKPSLFGTLICLVLFTASHSIADIRTIKQKKIVIYRLPKTMVVDFITGFHYHEMSDSMSHQLKISTATNLQNSRTMAQVTGRNAIHGLAGKGALRWFHGHTILFVNKTLNLKPANKPYPVDLLVITGNAGVSISQLLGRLKPRAVVLSPSNKLWKIDRWKKECRRLHLPCHSIQEEGPLVLDARLPLHLQVASAKK